MVLDRAVEIFNSYGVINVTYKNQEIWIENLNEKRGTVLAKYISNGNVEEIPISELHE